MASAWSSVGKSGTNYKLKGARTNRAAATQNITSWIGKTTAVKSWLWDRGIIPTEGACCSNEVCKEKRDNWIRGPLISRSWIRSEMWQTWAFPFDWRPTCFQNQNWHRLVLRQPICNDISSSTSYSKLSGECSLFNVKHTTNDHEIKLSCR